MSLDREPQTEPRAPGRHLTLFEPLSGFELGRTALAWRGLVAGQAREPRTIMLLPGFSGSERSMGLFERMLDARGHSVSHWGLGRNRGRVPTYVQQLVPEVIAMAERDDRPVELVGWSLGGVIAREIARAAPGSIRSVVTMGSPIQGGPKYTAFERYFRRRPELGVDVDAIAAMVAERNRQPLSVRQLNLYTKRDGVVGWQACIDPVSPGAVHREVSTTHVGLGAHAPTLRHVRDFVEG